MPLSQRPNSDLIHQMIIIPSKDAFSLSWGNSRIDRPQPVRDIKVQERNNSTDMTSNKPGIRDVHAQQ